MTTADTLDQAIRHVEWQLARLRPDYNVAGDELERVEDELVGLYRQRHAREGAEARAELAQLRCTEGALLARFREARTAEQAAADRLDEARALVERHPRPDRFSFSVGTPDPRHELARLHGLLAEAEMVHRAAANGKVGIADRLLAIRRRRTALLAQAAHAVEARR